MDIKEFLLARIAEDEAGLNEPTNADYCDDLSGRHYTNERIRSECAAKRAIVANLSPFGGWDDMFAPEILGTLAAVYSDHPDYQQEWSL